MAQSDNGTPTRLERCRAVKEIGARQIVGAGLSGHENCKMSVIIVFANGRDWFKANWVFRQLAQDISNRYRNDGELCKALEVAQALGCLDLKNMGDDLRGRIVGALRAVALDIISGAIAGWRPLEPKEHAMYCEAVSELAELIEGQPNISASSEDC